MQCLEIVRPERFADGLDHLDRHDAIEGASNIAVIAEFKRNLVSKSLLADAVPRKGQLLSGERHARYASALLGERSRERAPTASNLEHLIVALDVQELYD